MNGGKGILYLLPHLEKQSVFMSHVTCIQSLELLDDQQLRPGVSVFCGRQNLVKCGEADAGLGKSTLCTVLYRMLVIQSVNSSGNCFIIFSGNINGVATVVVIRQVFVRRSPIRGWRCVSNARL